MWTGFWFLEQFFGPRHHLKTTSLRGGTSDPCDLAWSDHPSAQERTPRCAVPLHERYIMPAWVEILINVMGYAGFIAIATYHKPSGDELPDR
jgi:hypothetical protein